MLITKLYNDLTYWKKASYSKSVKRVYNLSNVTMFFSVHLRKLANL